MMAKSYSGATFALPIALSAGILLGSSHSATAQQGSPQEQSQASRDKGSQASLWPGADPSRMLVTPARQIVGRDLTDADGRDSGIIKYLLIRLDAGKIVYALASAPGVQPVSEQFIAVPWQAVNAKDWLGWRTTGLSLDIPRDRVAQAPRYDMNDLMRLTSPIMQNRQTHFYVPQSQHQSSRQQQQERQQGRDNAQGGGETGEKAAQDGGETGQKAAEGSHVLIGTASVATVLPPPALTETQLVGSTVVGADGETLGRIGEIMVDVDEGRIPYVLVSAEEFLGPSERWIAIPPQTLEWQAGDTRYRAGKTRKELGEMETVTKQSTPVSIRKADLEKLYSFFEVEPYWN